MEADGGRCTVGCCSCYAEGACGFLAEIHIAQTNILSLVEVIDIEVLAPCALGKLVDDGTVVALTAGTSHQFARACDTYFLCAEPIAPSHRLGFDAAVGIERTDCRQHAVVQPIRHFLDGAVGIVVHLCHIHAATLEVLARLEVQEVVALPEDVALALEVHNAGMVAAVAVRGLHDVATALPWTLRRVGHSITQTFGTAGGSISEIPMALALIEPRSFLIVVDVVVEFHDVAFGRYHIATEADIVGVGIAPIHPRLAFLVDEDRRVNIIPMFLLPHERLAQRVAEGAIRRVGHEDPDAVAMKWRVEVVLAVALYGLNGPGAVVARAPLEVAQRGHGAMVGPVDHIGRGVKQPVVHKETGGVALAGIENLIGVGVVAHIEINGVAKDEGRGVGGVVGLKDRQVDIGIVAQLPPVEIEELRALTSVEREV